MENTLEQPATQTYFTIEDVNDLISDSLNNMKSETFNLIEYYVNRHFNTENRTYCLGFNSGGYNELYLTVDVINNRVKINLVKPSNVVNQAEVDEVEKYVNENLPSDSKYKYYYEPTTTPNNFFCIKDVAVYMQISLDVDSGEGVYKLTDSYECNDGAITIIYDNYGDDYEVRIHHNGNEKKFYLDNECDFSDDGVSPIENAIKFLNDCIPFDANFKS